MLGVPLRFHLMYVLRQNKTCLASSATPVSLWPWLQGLLWCSSNYASGLEALVSIYAMVGIAMYCCPYFLSSSLLAILMIGSVELNLGPQFNILAIIMMLALPRTAGCGQEPTGQQYFLVICSQTHAHTKTAIMHHMPLTFAVLSNGHNGRHAQERPYFSICNSK